MNTEREQKRSALDDFADSSTRTTNIPVTVSTAPVAQIVGAQQVAVYRDERRVLARLRELAQAMGEAWYYRYPVRNRKENRIDWIEGASIKLANDLARIYGNCEIDIRVQDFGDGWLFYARFLDLESGFSLTRPFQQRKSGGKIGGDDDARRLDIAFQIGASKAIRNVVVNSLQTFADFAFEEAKASLIERIGKDLPAYRTRTAEKVATHVTIERVEAVIGRTAEEWLAPDVARVIALMKGVSDGMAALDETFPPLGRPEKDPAKTLDAFTNDQESSPDPDSVDDGGEPDGEPSSAAAASVPPETAALKDEMMDKVLRLAADKEISPDMRVKLLDDQKADWLRELPDATDFVDKCFETAAQVARGEIKALDARRYLLGIRDK